MEWGAIMTKENLKTTVGNNLKLYRTMRHMTQEALAEKAGVSISFCANVERGTKGVSMFVLRDFADVLDITVNQLLYDHTDNQRIDNIMVLLRDQPEPFLNWLEKALGIPYVSISTQQIEDT